MSRTLGNTGFSGAERNVPDIKKSGKGDLFTLIGKAWSDDEGWMKSTKAMEITGVGCLVQVTTQSGDQVAEALAFAPGVRIGGTGDNRRLVPILYQEEASS